MCKLLLVSVTACGCNLMGSVRDDCEQMTGRCICRSGVTGQKCSVCTNGKQLVVPGSCQGIPSLYCFDAVGFKTVARLRCGGK